MASSGTDIGNDCRNDAAPCATVQHAVDATHLGDEIRVAAGTYTDLTVRPRSDVAMAARYDRRSEAANVARALP